MLKILQKPFLIIYCFLLFMSVPAMAEIDPYENTLMGPFQNGATFTVKDNKFQNNNYNWADITNFSVKDAVTLRVVDNVLIPYQFKYTVSLQINYYTDPNSGPTSVNRNLTVNYDPAQGVSYKGTDSYTFEGAYKITVTVLSVDAHGGTTPTGPVVQLSSNIVVNRQSLFQPQNSINPAIALADHNQVKLNWDFVSGAEEYDIEWTTINSGNENFLTVDRKQNGTLYDDNVYKNVLNQIFRNNASRVTTDKHDYTLSVVSTDNYLIIRIRQVQYSQDGVRLTGEWDYRQKDGGYATFPISWNEPGLNWQYSAAFAEEGKKKEVVSYFDGTLRSRQTVTLNNSDSVAIAQETVYDEFGRKAASILPAPFREDAGKPYLHYAVNFNLNPSGSPYNFLNLQGQLANCEPTPDPLNISSGASKYYSSNNSFLTSADKAFNKFIPDASGFPIAVTQYTSDNTGRMKLQGGVGLAFQPGAGSNGEASKTTKYYYGKPEQWELDQLFGNDVGYAEHYLKNMVVDPNGQISISYLNGSGKTIATALTGAAPANLKALPSYSPEGKLKRTGLLKPEQFVYNSSELKLTATTTYLASVTGPGTLTYNIQKLVSQYPGSAFQICSNCYYEMSVKVVNDCNEQVAGTSSPVQIGSMLANCADTARYQDSLVVPFNQIGEYHVTIEFAFNKDVIDQYTDAFIIQGQANGAVEKEFDYIKKRYLDSLDISGCYADCKTCNVLLGGQGDFVQMLKGKFLAMDLDAASVNGASFDTWANNLYTSLKAKCTALQGSCDLSPCSAIQSQMQDDVSPGGQYALFSASGIALEPNINALTMFSKGNVDPNWRVQFPILPSTSDLYQSELITLDDGTQTSPYDANFTIQMLIKYWKTDWGTKFLIYHPEYCKLQFCQTMSAFESWDQNVEQQINKASDVPAIPGGANLTYNSSNPSDWLLSADPFFQAGAPGYNLQSRFRADLLQYSSRVLGITSASAQIKGLSEFKSYLLYCADPNAATTTGSSANGDAWNNCLPNDNCRVPDREWTSYRDGYFELKEKYYTILRIAACGSTCPVGQPIAVPLAGDCPVAADFSISTITNGSPACAGSKTVLVAHDAGSLTQAVTVALYYPPGVQSSSLPQTLQFAAGESQKSFCIPEEINLDGIAIKSVGCMTATQEAAIIGTWDYYMSTSYPIDSNGQIVGLPLANDYGYTFDDNYIAHYDFRADHSLHVYINSPNDWDFYLTWKLDKNGNVVTSSSLFDESRTTPPRTYGIKENNGNSLILTEELSQPANTTNLFYGHDQYFRKAGSTYKFPIPQVTVWAHMAKENDRVVTDDGSPYSVADFNIKIFKGGDETHHPEPSNANKTFYYNGIIYIIKDNLNINAPIDYRVAQFRGKSVLNVNINNPNKYYSAGNFDLFWSLSPDLSQTGEESQWKFLGYQQNLPLMGTPPVPDLGSDDNTNLPNGYASSSIYCITPYSSTNYWAESTSKGINLITNGDFSFGNTGFSSTYTYIYPDGSYSNPNATSAGGFYRFTTNPQLVGSSYYSFGDHTTGSGTMLYLDGGANPSAPCWSKNVAVEPNKTYVFSVWASTSTNNAANLQFKINGAQAGSTLQLTETPGWQNFLVQWSSGSNTSAILGIHDLNTSPDGNDFVLDDIVFAPVCVAIPVSASCISPSSTTNYFAEAANKGINQAANGDFSSGNTGFSSTYTYINPDGSYSDPNATSVGGFYHFTTNPQLVNPNYFSFGDHTTGSGQMMYLDGGADPTAACWSKNVTVEPNKAYVFSVWSSTAAGNAANLQFKINGAQVGGTLQLSESPGWQNFLVQWGSGSNTSAVLSIHDLNTDAGGNDFVLDDIVFAPVCTAPTTNPTCVIPSATTNYWTESTGKGINKIVNGDFSAGTNSFTSLYNYVSPTGSTGSAGALTAEGYYTVTTNPKITHSDFSFFGDHTSGTGNMMVINGGVSPTDAVWQQQVTVEPNKSYAFSFWAASATPANPANLQLSVDGNLVGRNFIISSTVGEWRNFTGSWTSGSSTNVVLKITNTVTEPGGNDFTLDDIVFAPICTSEDCPEAYAYKQSRFPSVAATPLMVTTSAQGNQLLEDTKASILAMASDQFKAESVTWMAQLTPGLDAIGASQPTRDLLRANLVAVCLAGSDLVHPYGASTLPAGTTAGNGYSSFGDAIKGVLGLSGYTSSLNPWLIDAPYPYLPLQQSVEKTISATSNQICSLLAALSQGAQARNMDLYSFLVATYHDAMTLTPAEVASLQKSCSNCRFILPQDITLPVFLEPGTKGCISASEYNAAQNDFNNAFGGSLATTDANYENIFSNFMNHRWGFSLTYDDYKQFETTAAGNPAASLCNTRPYTSTDGDPYACIKSAMEVAVANGEKDYSTYITEQKAAFRANYISTCSLAQANAGLSANQQMYHYTLYYYDQADNLVRTVPPEGVNLLSDNELAGAENYRKNADNIPGYNGGYSPVYPSHSLMTNYVYNSTNQVVQQTSPDGGTNRFWYDYISRPIISQNDKQLANNDYSYTAYDALGRITEVGQKNQTTIDLGESGYRYEDPFSPSFLSSGTNSQITQTIYDIQPDATGGIPAGLVQENLRKRVAASLYRETQGADVLRASYYNYDLDGNVKTLTQQVDGIGLKQLDYEYDLISGKVNFVRYQHGQPDQFYYKYSYDAENRITDAWSGTAAMVDIYRGSSLLPHNQKLDAHYDYYLHGPFARTELGDVYGKVQGTDYAYTLQGWLKGMNSISDRAGQDMGADGNPGIHSTIPRDAHAMALFYHTNDYSPVSGSNPFLHITDYIREGNGQENFTPLYNGNIAAGTSKLGKLGDQAFRVYKYDQLNRLTEANVFFSNLPYNLNHYKTFDEAFTYDGNGNILTANRNAGGPLVMDNLAYAYNRGGNGKLLNNKLRHVKDGVAYWAFNADLDDQPDDNYSYDAIGNLVKDAQEGIDSIGWTVYGKIRSIGKSDGTRISYAYGPSGNRVSKTVNGVTTWYIRDAQGNTMGLYDNRGGGSNWREQHLYGSSRLGIWSPNINLSSGNGTAAWDTIGNKGYELVNHLGNVMATISDKRLQHSPDGAAIDYFDADVQSAQDYYAFGEPMRSRSYSAGKGSYRYGFNGKENDNEVKKDGDGNPNVGSQQDYGMRIYDPRLGRFLSVDPIGKEYPELTSYQFASNSPIENIDIDGLEKYSIHYTVKDGKNIILNITTDNSKKYQASPTIGGIPTWKPKVAEYIKVDKNNNVLSKSGELPLKNLGSTMYVGPWNPNKDKSGNEFYLPAINSLDAAGLKHDKAYAAVQAAGASSAIADLNVINADKALVKDAADIVGMFLNGRNDPITKQKVSYETMSTAYNVLKTFSAIVVEKSIRIGLKDSAKEFKNQTDKLIQTIDLGLKSIDKWTPTSPH